MEIFMLRLSIVFLSIAVYFLFKTNKIILKMLESIEKDQIILAKGQREIWKELLKHKSNQPNPNAEELL